MPHLKTATAALLCAAFSASWPSAADQHKINTEAETPWYQIELVVFSQPQDNLMAEFWDERITAPADWPNAIRLLPMDADPAMIPILPAYTKVTEPNVDPAPAGSNLNPLIEGPDEEPATLDPTVYEHDAYRLLEQAEEGVSITDDRLTRRGYRPIFRAAWRQPTVEREHARPVLIQSEQQLASGVPSLLGSITLSVSRFLHLETDLYFSTPLPPGWFSMRPLTPEEEAANAAALTLKSAMASEAAVSGAPEQAEALPLDQTELLLPEPKQLTLHLDQRRRMRSGELHYIDHPMLGILVKVTPYERPKPEPELLPPATTASASVSASTQSPQQSRN